MSEDHIPRIGTPSLVGSSVRSIIEDNTNDLTAVSSRSTSRPPLKTLKSDLNVHEYTTVAELMDEGALTREDEAYDNIMDDAGKVDVSKSTVIVLPDPDTDKEKEPETKHDFTGNEVVEAQHPSPDLKIYESKHSDFVVIDIPKSDAADELTTESTYPTNPEVSLEDLIDSQMASINEYSSGLVNKVGKKNKKKKKKSRSASASKESSPSPETGSTDTNDSVSENSKESSAQPEVEPEIANSDAHTEDAKDELKEFDTKEPVQDISEKLGELSLKETIVKPVEKETSSTSESIKEKAEDQKTQLDAGEDTLKSEGTTPQNVPLKSKSKKNKKKKKANAKTTQKDDTSSKESSVDLVETTESIKDEADTPSIKESSIDVKESVDAIEKDAVSSKEETKEEAKDVIIPDAAENVKETVEETVETPTEDAEIKDATEEGTHFAAQTDVVTAEETKEEIVDKAVKPKSENGSDEVVKSKDETDSKEVAEPADQLMEDIKVSDQSVTEDILAALNVKSAQNKETEVLIKELSNVPADLTEDSVKDLKSVDIKKVESGNILDETERLISELEAEIGNVSATAIEDTETKEGIQELTKTDLLTKDDKETEITKDTEEIEKTDVTTIMNKSEDAEEVKDSKVETKEQETVKDTKLESDQEVTKEVSEPAPELVTKDASEHISESVSKEVPEPVPETKVKEEEQEEELHEPTKEEIIELLKDEPVYIYTSLAGGGFHMPQRTNKLATILTANRIPFTYRDLGTDEQARGVWRRYSSGRLLPGVVRGKDDIIGNWEEIEEANEDYRVRELIYETL